MAYEKGAFNKFLIENKCVGFFEKPITLASGRESYWYVNMRNLTDSVKVKDELISFLYNFLSNTDLKADFFFGVPAGATKIALFLSDFYAKNENIDMPLVLGREKEKQHGSAKDKYFIGPAKGSCIIIEDVTTTGGSLISSIKKLQEADIEIKAAIGLVNRMEKRDDGLSVAEAVEELGVSYYCLTDALSVLPLAYSSLKPNDEVVKKVEEGFKEFGVEELKLK